MFTEEELRELWAEGITGQPGKPAVLRIALATARILAARGGKMTAEEVEQYVSGLPLVYDHGAIRWHIAAQGATVATLQADLDRVAANRAELVQSVVSAVQERDSALAEVERLREQLVTAQHEVARTDAALRVIAPELIARLTSSCVWCSDEPPEGMQPNALTEYVREHVKTCSAHPMRALEAELARLKPSGQVAEDLDSVRAWLAQVPARIQDALTRLAAKAQGYGAAESRLAAIRERFLNTTEVNERLKGTDSTAWQKAWSVLRWVLEGDAPQGGTDAR